MRSARSCRVILAACQVVACALLHAADQPDGDVDALVDGANLAVAVDGNASTRPLGIAPNKYFASATQLLATFLSGSGNLADASAGECTIEVYFTSGT
jgi:hypothetical protein